MKNNNLKKMIGKFGESVAVKYLMDSGFEILQRNYRNKVGELDIVCQKDNGIHAVEVKTIMGDSREELVRPEDHLDSKKIRKVVKVASLYALEKDIAENQNISIDALLVRLFQGEKGVFYKFPKNIERITVVHMKNIDVV